MNTKTIAALLIGAMALAASFSTPAEARHHHRYGNQFYGNSWNGNYGAYGRGNGFHQAGAFGLNQNNPNYFRQAQQAQWAQAHGGAGFGHGGNALGHGWMGRH